MRNLRAVHPSSEERIRELEDWIFEHVDRLHGWKGDIGRSASKLLRLPYEYEDGS